MIDPMTISAGASILGGLMGGKKSTQTVDNTPHWYKGEKGKEITELGQGNYIDFLNAVAANAKAPFEPTPTQRYSSGAGGAYGTLFDNPEGMILQGNADRTYIDSLINPPPVAAPAPVQQPQAAAFSPQDEVFIKQYESGQIPQKPFAMQYQDAIKRRSESGKVPLPMGGYLPMGGA